MLDISRIMQSSIGTALNKAEIISTKCFIDGYEVCNDRIVWKILACRVIASSLARTSQTSCGKVITVVRNVRTNSGGGFITKTSRKQHCAIWDRLTDLRANNASMIFRHIK
jgi:hypothetical protein